MLKSLEIQNVALIDKLNIDFSSKLNVLSGETGAGKSIIIDALNFVIGGKTIKSLIKQGQTFMKVNAMFVMPFSKEVEEILNEYDIEFDDEILISRKYTVEGKGDIKVNGTTLTAGMLKNLTSLLIDIHGQHEHQHLLKDKYHLGIIDCFIKNKELFNEYQLKLAELKEIQHQIKKLNGSTENQERMLDLLDYQIKEIEKANLKIGEDDELFQKKTAMINFEKINDSLSSAISELDSQTSVSDSCKKATSLLNNISRFDDSLNSLAERLQSVRFEVVDIIETLKQKKEECNFNQAEFDEIDERLDKIKLLKKKYGSTIEEILTFLNKAKEDYDNIVNSKDKLQKALKQKTEVLCKLHDLALNISKVRKDIAIKFETDVKQQLNDLGMKSSKFKVDFSPLPNKDNCESSFNSTGFDDVKFLFSANAGQDLKPLSEIISGGEASRFMLALKNILAQNDNISSMVFDEIDTGISGDMGYKVACKLANIAKSHQVMSVSHLPQICAMADQNIKITKVVENDNTFVTAKTLTPDESLKEISRLSGGTVDSAASIEHAKELKNRCNQYKKEI